MYYSQTRCKKFNSGYITAHIASWHVDGSCARSHYPVASRTYTQEECPNFVWRWVLSRVTPDMSEFIAYFYSFNLYFLLAEKNTKKYKYKTRLHTWIQTMRIHWKTMRRNAETDPGHNLSPSDSNLFPGLRHLFPGYISVAKPDVVNPIRNLHACF
jgi:hypothetical protein